MNLAPFIDNLPIDVSKLLPLQKIEAVEYFLKENFSDNQQEFPLRHYRIGTKYAREIFLKAGSFLTSKVHNFNHISTISQGKVTIMTEFDTNDKEAPCTWFEDAGIKRLIYVHEDTVWTTFHEVPIDMNDPEELTNYIAHNSDLSWINENRILS